MILSLNSEFDIISGWLNKKEDAADDPETNITTHQHMRVLKCKAVCGIGEYVARCCHAWQ